MRNTGKIQIISVESRKGGVGKTSAALNIAKPRLYIPVTKKELDSPDSSPMPTSTGGNYNVIFLDLDISGTASTEFESKDIFDECHVVHKPINKKGKVDKSKENEKLNLVDLFEKYMSGEDVPNVIVEKEKATKAKGVKANEDDSYMLPRPEIVLKPGKINIFSSLLERDYSNGNKKAHKYGPSILFDETHSAWFMDMLKELVEKCRAAFESAAEDKKGKERKLLVIIDNSPGYSGLEPVVEEWTSDLGPECGKTLFVSSLDSQDFDACATAIRELSGLFADKWDASRALIELSKTKSNDEATYIYDNLTGRQKKFLQRLVDTAPAQPEICKTIKSPPIEHPTCTNCGLCFYRQEGKGCADDYYSDTPDKIVYCGNFINLVFNKIPADPGRKNIAFSGKTPAWLKKYNFFTFLKKTGYSPEISNGKIRYTFDEMRSKLNSLENEAKAVNKSKINLGEQDKQERVHLISTVLEDKIENMSVLYMENIALQYILARLEKESK